MSSVLGSWDVYSHYPVHVTVVGMPVDVAGPADLNATDGVVPLALCVDVSQLHLVGMFKHIQGRQNREDLWDMSKWLADEGMDEGKCP